MKIKSTLVLIIILNSLFAIGVNTDSLTSIIENQKGNEKAVSLNLLGESLFSSSPRKALKYFNESYEISKGKNYKTEILAISNLVRAYSRARKYDSSDLFVAKGLNLSRAQQDTVRMMEFLTNIGWTYDYQGNYNQAMTSFNEALVLFRIFNQNHPGHPDVNVLNYARLLNNKATIFAKQAYYDSAIIYYKESLEFRQKHNAGNKYIAPTLLNIGAVCYKNGNYKLANEYFINALAKYTDLGDSARIASCYGNLGTISKETGENDTAIGYYEKSLDINRHIKNVRGQIVTLNNLGAIYLKEGQEEKARQYLTQALTLNSDSRYKSSLAVSYQNLANYYLQTNNYSKAIEAALKSLKIMEEKGQRSNMEDVYQVLSSAYEKQGKFDVSLHYFKLNKALHDSIFNANSRANYNKLQLQLETSQKERKIEMLKKEQEKQVLMNKILKNEKQNYVMAIAIILFMIIVVAFVVLMKRKKDRQIYRQQQLVDEREKELARVELEKSRLKEEELQKSIRYKSKQLSTHALQMMQKTTMLQEIFSDIKALTKNATDDDKQKISQITRKITQNLRSQKDWDIFKLYFEDVNRNFYKKLKEINPDLTTNDHRLCALIKLNMTPKEMASVLNVAPNSVKSSRYRLKKKLGLSVEADLEEFIRGLE